MKMQWFKVRSKTN